jgi:3-oxoacid CoA-transferase subunit A
MPNKVFENLGAALSSVLFDGMTIMSGGFGLSGNPESLIAAIRDAGVKRLTVISITAAQKVSAFGFCSKAARSPR